MNEDEWIIDPGFQLEGFEPAGSYSIAPYRPRGADERRCAKAGCMGFHTKKSKFCVGHARVFDPKSVKKAEKK